MKQMEKKQKKWNRNEANVKKHQIHLKSPSQELVLDLQEVPFTNIHLKRLVDDAETRIRLDILPSTIPMRNYPREQPVIVSPVPNLVLATRSRRLFFIQPQSVKLSKTAVCDVEHEPFLHPTFFQFRDFLLTFFHLKQ